MDIYIYIYPLRAATPERGIFWAERVFVAKSWRKTLETRNILETRNDPQEAVGNHV